jgi:hypothetical protein
MTMKGPLNLVLVSWLILGGRKIPKKEGGQNRTGKVFEVGEASSSAYLLDIVGQFRGDF